LFIVGIAVLIWKVTEKKKKAASKQQGVKQQVASMVDSKAETATWGGNHLSGELAT